jgi:nucleoside-diphosphate-sugar epimerase
VVRLPQVHDTKKQGLISPYIANARAKGSCGYIGEGANRWPAGNRGDAAVLYRLALEKGEAGAAYSAVGDEGVSTRAIAEALGARLGLPTASIAPDEAMAQFGWIGMLASVDMPASSQLTQQRLGWRPSHPGLLEDIATAPSLSGQALTA